MSRDSPRISVCICTYNGARVVETAIDSVLGQTCGDFELVVVDDASVDGTLDVVARYDDQRIRVVRNRRNLGNARNRSKAMAASRGELIKFVDQDDRLAPACLAEHRRLFDVTPSLGLSFSRRDIASLDGDVAALDLWRDRYGEPYVGFGELREVNSGAALLQRYFDTGLFQNWIGEPTCVMVRRSSLAQTGLCNRFVRQMIDMDLWIRLMAFFDVGFLDSELATRGIGASTETASNLMDRRPWLDNLWVLEGLKEFPALWSRYPALAARRRGEQKSLVVAAVTGRYRNRRAIEAISDVARYLVHVSKAAAGSRRSVYDWPA